MLDAGALMAHDDAGAMVHAIAAPMVMVMMVRVMMVMMVMEMVLGGMLMGPCEQQASLATCPSLVQ